MPTQDTCVSIEPCFKVKPGQMPAFKKLCEQFIAKTKDDPNCLYYGFAFDGDLVICREGYTSADAALAHVGSVGALLDEAFKVSDLMRLEFIGPAQELAKLRGPTAVFKPKLYTLECGFRK